MGELAAEDGDGEPLRRMPDLGGGGREGEELVEARA